jgi:hypothetical protein
MADVMYSFGGYQSYQARVAVKDVADTKVNIKWIPLQQQLNEIQVKAKRQDLGETAEKFKRERGPITSHSSSSRISNRL